MASKILETLKGLSAANVFNPWRDRDPLDLRGHGPIERCRRLLEHFDCDPTFILVGEAPSYRGCHFSGVPFTSEARICEELVPRIGNKGRFTSRPRPWSEPSATTVWNTLYHHAMAERTILWNAFAWHPHDPGNRLSNRRPTEAETKGPGAEALRLVLNHFSDAKPVAVGRVAERALQYVTGKKPPAVRHPSMGGVPLFKAGINALSREILDKK